MRISKVCTIINLEGDILNIVNELLNYCTELIVNGGLIIGVFLIILESFIPILPLGVMVALISNAYGLFLGILISWLSNCIGCYLTYLIFYHLSDKVSNRLLPKKIKEQIDSGTEKFKKISLPSLAAIITLPFTPSFLINILSGASKMSKKKYLTAIAIGKVFMISFWAYIGKSFIESMTDLKTIIILSIMIIIAYVISKIVSKRINIE